MSISKVNSYQTSDGKVFTNLDKAKVHQAILENEGNIKAFIETLDSPRGMSTAKRILGEYFAFLVTKNNTERSAEEEIAEEELARVEEELNEPEPAEEDEDEDYEPELELDADDEDANTPD